VRDAVVVPVLAIAGGSAINLGRERIDSAEQEVCLQHCLRVRRDDLGDVGQNRLRSHDNGLVVTRRKAFNDFVEAVEVSGFFECEIIRVLDG